jgi:PadR family transcriptional regulator PadR
MAAPRAPAVSPLGMKATLERLILLSRLVDTLTFDLFRRMLRGRRLRYCMPSPRFPIPQGTLDMLILQILSLEPAHGYGIAQRLEQISQSVVQVNQGSLYPALHRLEQKEWLQADWRQSETGREAKFYSLTRSGRKQLAAEKDSWARLTGAVQLIFDEGDR